MSKALDKILVNNEPFHLVKTDRWGVPAYWIETQFQGEESVKEIIERLLVWLRLGLSLEEVKSIDKFKSDNSNLDFEDFRWGIFSYCDAVCSHPEYKKFVDDLYPNLKESSKGDRVDLIVPKHLDI